MAIINGRKGNFLGENNHISLYVLPSHHRSDDAQQLVTTIRTKRQSNSQRLTKIKPTNSKHHNV